VGATVDKERWAGKTHLSWSTGSHKRKMTLLEAPTGTLTFYYKAGGIWCVEEVGAHHGQEISLKRDFDSSRKKWTFGSGPLLCQRFRSRREETACKRKTIEISPSICDDYVTRVDVRCF